MDAPVSKQCRTCITTFKSIISVLSGPDKTRGLINHEEVTNELERFSLWTGNIGALHRPESSMSLESRLREAKDVLNHTLELLGDLVEVTAELLEITSGAREGEMAFASHDDGDEEEQNEESELLEESAACITRLFRVSSLIRQATPTDLFYKALSRNRYRFNDQFDIAHVGEKYPKLATKELAWLQKRLGQAITQRRHYLSYVQDHREKLEGLFVHEETPDIGAHKPQVANTQLSATMLPPDSLSRPSTFFTKASSLAPELITPKMLAMEDESDPVDDTRSYTTISRTDDGDLESSNAAKIPRLDEVRTGFRKEVECPFCFRVKTFEHEREWRRHVFSDLRSYVCTFPDCDVPYFGDINDWFRHEMQIHRVSYTCQLCQNKTFPVKNRYLSHVRNQHPEMLEIGEDHSVLDIARKPLEQLFPQDCPCCLDWVDRLEERASVAGIPPDSADNIISVTPNVFKRHLASHQEELAQFAVPIPSAESDFNSNVAVDIGDPVPATEKHGQRNLNAEVMQWLSPPDPSINYRHGLRERLEGTGRWFLDSSQFCDWKTGKLNCPTLWLTGIPGCGKTILSCSIIEDLEASQTSDSLILYFFFDFSDESKQTFEGMIRSLIFKFCGSDEKMTSTVEQLFEECGEGKQKPLLEKLCDILQEFMVKLPNVFLVLDALDECTTRESLLGWLATIFQMANIRSIVTNGNNKKMYGLLLQWIKPENIRRFRDEMSEDIKAYVQQSFWHWDNSGLKTTFWYEPEILEQIEHRIVENSGARFLLAVCQTHMCRVDVLESPTRRDLFKAIERLPGNLTEIYDDTLRKIRDEDQLNSIRILQILRNAKRPLTINEAIDILDEASEQTPSVQAEHRMPDLRKTLESCSHLVTMFEEGGYIRLAHASVKEYLTSSIGSELLDK